MRVLHWIVQLHYLKFPRALTVTVLEKSLGSAENNNRVGWFIVTKHFFLTAGWKFKLVGLEPGLCCRSADTLCRLKAWSKSAESPGEMTTSEA